jgi:Na+/H+ antiporter NhaD/arsenite permease-like protein
MILTIIILFVVGYLCIALEHPLKVDKTATSLLLGMLLWVIYAMGAESLVPLGSADRFASYLADNPSVAARSAHDQALSFVLNVDIVEHLGDICQTILFLLGAMTIVELIDVHGGFTVITDHIVTRRKRRLLYLVSAVTFFLSAVLDNMTTTIVMLMLIRKLVPEKVDRWIYAACIVIAANSGGAWSPIGDVTTIMLWVKGNVTVVALAKYVLLPSLVSAALPVWLASRSLHGELAPMKVTPSDMLGSITYGEKLTMFILGVGGLLFVPVFKSVTHLPPFVGILFVLGALWVFTECYYNGKMLDKARELRLPKVIARVDMPSILFFLGILMAVAVLQSTGVLATIAGFLDKDVHNIFAIDSLLGVLSSIIDNVPMVAGVMGMYPVADLGATGYAANFVVDGHFWGLLSYCAGVGGSLLIIGSAAGVIAMGLEKINFGWYLKRFSGLALLGYVAGLVVYAIEFMLY